MARNGAWTREQLVLALDLYLRVGQGNLPRADARLVTLAKATTVLAEADGVPGQARGDGAVYMKLQNLKAVDPSHPGGLPNAGAADRTVWDELAGDPDRLWDEVVAVLDRALAAGWDGTGWYWDSVDTLQEPRQRYAIAASTATVSPANAAVVAFYRSLGFAVEPSPLGSPDQLRCVDADGNLRRVFVREVLPGTGIVLTAEEAAAVAGGPGRAALFVVEAGGAGRLLRAEDPWEIASERLVPTRWEYRID